MACIGEERFWSLVVFPIFFFGVASKPTAIMDRWNTENFWRWWWWWWCFQGQRKYKERYSKLTAMCVDDLAYSRSCWWCTTCLSCCVYVCVVHVCLTVWYIPIAFRTLSFGRNIRCMYNHIWICMQRCGCSDKRTVNKKFGLSSDSSERYRNASSCALQYFSNKNTSHIQHLNICAQTTDQKETKGKVMKI